MWNLYLSFWAHGEVPEIPCGFLRWRRPALHSELQAGEQGGELTALSITHPHGTLRDCLSLVFPKPTAQKSHLAANCPTCRLQIPGQQCLQGPGGGGGAQDHQQAQAGSGGLEASQADPVSSHNAEADMRAGQNLP